MDTTLLIPIVRNDVIPNLINMVKHIKQPQTIQLKNEILFLIIQMVINMKKSGNVNSNVYKKINLLMFQILYLNSNSH